MSRALRQAAYAGSEMPAVSLVIDEVAMTKLAVFLGGFLLLTLLIGLLGTIPPS